MENLELMGILAALWTIAGIVVKATPTKKDDKFYAFLNPIAMFFFRDRKKGGGIHKKIK